MTSNRDIIAAMAGALNDGDIDRFVSYYADDVSVELMTSGRRMQGADGVRDWIVDAFDRLDGFSNDVLGIYGDGDTVVLEVIARGVANREIAGRAPGEALDAHEVYVYSLSEGKIHGVRGYH
jgi:steroid delta-isomerase-like uncharacterized protein